MKKLLLLVITSIFLLSFISAQTQYSLPDVKINTCVELLQSCANCTFVNITTLHYPPRSNQSSIDINVQMIRNYNSYTYEFCGNNVTGEYSYDTFGNPDGFLTTASVSYTVTPTGDTLTGTEGAFYFIIFLCLVAIIVYLANRLNIAESPGAQVGYLLLAYLFFLITTFFVYRLSADYLPTLAYINQILYVFFIVILILFLPILIASIGYMITIQISRMREDELIKRGHSREEAQNRLSRK